MTIRSVVRPYVYKTLQVISKGIECCFISLAAVLILTILSPLIIPVAIKAWFDEKPIIEAIEKSLGGEV